MTFSRLAETIRENLSATLLEPTSTTKDEVDHAVVRFANDIWRLTDAIDTVHDLGGQLTDAFRDHVEKIAFSCLAVFLSHPYEAEAPDKKWPDGWPILRLSRADSETWAAHLPLDPPIHPGATDMVRFDSAQELTCTDIGLGKLVPSEGESTDRALWYSARAHFNHPQIESLSLRLRVDYEKFPFDLVELEATAPMFRHQPS